MCNQEKEIYDILTKHAKYELSIEQRKQIAHELWLRESKLLLQKEEIISKIIKILSNYSKS